MTRGQVSYAFLAVVSAPSLLLWEWKTKTATRNRMNSAQKQCDSGPVVPGAGFELGPAS